MTDLNPPPRLFECSWLIIDLEHVKSVTRFPASETDKHPNGRISVRVFGEEADPYEFTDDDGDYADGEAFIVAWKEYRAFKTTTRL